MAFVDLEKAFDRVPRDVIWWAMRKLGIDEWLVRLVQSMYKDVRSRVRVGSGYSEEFGVKVGVHQGSVLSPLLFIIVLEALSREFRTGCPWELLYADDLMISAESMEELLVKLKTWKAEMVRKSLRVNMGKTKIMVSGPNLDLLKLEDHWSCSSPERLSHFKLMRFKLIENRPMKVYAWTLLTPGAWPNLTQGHDWHNL